MFTAVGIDLLSIDRVRRVLDRHRERFLARVYTPEEVAYCRGRVNELAARFAARNGSSLSEDAIAALSAYDWPGNVRELENVIERSAVLSGKQVLQAADLRMDAARPRTAGDGFFLPPGVTLEQHEQQLIREALHRSGGNKSQAARLLGLTRNAFRYRLAQMGMEDKDG